LTLFGSIARLILINLLVTVGVLEISLRAQQELGPLYDLDIRPESVLVGLSDELNHVHPPGIEWDRDGIRRMDEPNAAHCALRLLFMGDSFMQGFGPGDTVPVHVRRILSQEAGKDVCVFNAGCSSYSPSIFVPQAKKLLRLVEPNVTIIDIDETDLFDDYHRYRPLVARDATGSIAGVRRTAIAESFQQGLVDSTSKLLYVHRLVSKLYFTRLAYPRQFARYYRDKPADIFWLSRLPDDEARTRFGAEIEYFRSTLDDLTRTVLARIAAPDGLLYVHHPHLQHLGGGGAAFNNIVAETVREVASRHRVGFYDATADLKSEFGATPQRYYVANDMHLNEAGIRAYGAAVARHLAGMLDRGVASH
jgi:hypothetical protein